MHHTYIANSDDFKFLVSTSGKICFIRNLFFCLVALYIYNTNIIKFIFLETK